MGAVRAPGRLEQDIHGLLSSAQTTITALSPKPPNVSVAFFQGELNFFLFSLCRRQTSILELHALPTAWKVPPAPEHNTAALSGSGSLRGENAARL